MADSGLNRLLLLSMQISFKRHLHSADNEWVALRDLGILAKY